VPGPILQERGYSQLEDITAENGVCQKMGPGTIFLAPFFL